MKRTITAHQLNLLAGILAVSNCGISMTEVSRSIEWLKKHPLSANYVKGEYAVQIASSLIESDEMEEGFRSEGACWVKTLSKMPDKKIASTWPDAWKLAVE